jgi:hypothetical protein
VQLDLDAFALENRLDQLLETARHDMHVPAGCLRRAHELREAGPDLRFAQHPVDDLFERRRDRDELAHDHLAQRQPPLVEAVLDLLVDGGVAELERDPVEQIGFRDRAVEVEDDGTARDAVISGIRARHAIMFPEASSAEVD